MGLRGPVAPPCSPAPPRARRLRSATDRLPPLPGQAAQAGTGNAPGGNRYGGEAESGLLDRHACDVGQHRAHVLTSTSLAQDFLNKRWSFGKGATAIPSSSLARRGINRLRDAEDELATGVAGFGEAVGLGRVLEVEGTVHLDLQVAPLDQLGEAREADRVRPDEEAGGPPLALLRLREEVLRHAAGDRDEHPAGPQHAKRALAVDAWEVDGGIEVGDQVLEALGLVVDDPVDSKLAQPVRLLGASGA